MKGSYSAQMLSKSSTRRDYDSNKQNKSINRKPSLKTGKNVIQQYANNSKPHSSYHRQQHNSPIYSNRETIENTLIQEESSCEPSQSVELSQNRLKINEQFTEEDPRLEQSLKEMQVVRKDVKMIKSQIQTKDLEMSSMRIMYESQLNNLSKNISTHKQKDQQEKTTLVREINNKNIEIQKMRDSFELLQSENQNMSIYLKQKQQRIIELQKELDTTMQERKELQQHFNSINQSQDLLKIVESQMEELVDDNKIKMKLIEQNKITISNMSTQIVSLKDKVAQLNRQIKSYQEREAHTVVDLEEDIKKYKQTIIKLNKQTLRIPDLEIKLKQANSELEEYKNRITTLLQNNDKMNIQLMNNSGTERKMNDLEWQLSQAKKTIIDTEDKLLKIREEFEDRKKQDIVNQLTEELNTVTLQVYSQSREIQELRNRIQGTQQEKQIKNKEIQKLQSQIVKLKERVSNTDTLYKQNNRLSSVLKEKVTTIQRLQFLINDYDAKLNVINSECTQREIQTERILHHTRELQGKCFSQQESLSKIKYERQTVAQKLKQKQIQLGVCTQMLDNFKEEVRCLKESKESNSRKYQQETKNYQLKLNLHLIAKNQMENNLQRETDKYLSTKRNWEESQEKIHKLAEESMYKQQIIKTQTISNTKLSKDVNILEQRLKVKQAQIQKINKWKQSYLGFMQNYSSLQKQMRKNVLLLQETNQ